MAFSPLYAVTEETAPAVDTLAGLTDRDRIVTK
jgi:hypothetical protein